MDPIIEVKGLTKTYAGGVTALDIELATFMDKAAG